MLPCTPGHRCCARLPPPNSAHSLLLLPTYPPFFLFLICSGLRPLHHLPVEVSCGSTSIKNHTLRVRGPLLARRQDIFTSHNSRTALAQDFDQTYRQDAGHHNAYAAGPGGRPSGLSQPLHFPSQSRTAAAAQRHAGRHKRPSRGHHQHVSSHPSNSNSHSHPNVGHPTAKRNPPPRAAQRRDLASATAPGGRLRSLRSDRSSCRRRHHHHCSSRASPDHGAAVRRPRGRLGAGERGLQPDDVL